MNHLINVSDPPSKTIDDITAKDFKQLFDLNVMAGFLCCKVGVLVIFKIFDEMPDKNL